MKKLVISIIALIALFAALRAWPQGTGLGVQLHPGLVEVSDGSSSVTLAFGIVDRQPGGRTWSLLPLRLVYTSGNRSVSVALNGLSFLTRGGATVGRPVRVTSARSGDVISIGGKVTVDAPVTGDVWTLGADIQLGPRAVVSGDVVALGGKVSAAAKAVVRGSINQVPQIKIPFVGVLGTELSAQVVALGRQVLGYLLFGAALFLVCFYATPRARAFYDGVSLSWRASLITLVAWIVLVPVLSVLLIVSVIGIFFLPILVFALGVLGIYGLVLLCARGGGALRGKAAGGADALYLFTSGLLGLFLLKAPALVGIGLTLIRSDGAARAGQILQLVTLGFTAAGMLYGTAAALSHMRIRSARPAS
jgi:hypothetical protein